MTDEDLADAAALKVSEVRAGMSALAEIGLIERTEAWRVVKWDERQYESDNSTKRTRKHRSSNGDVTALEGSIAVDVTPPENREQKTDTETEKTKSARAETAPTRSKPRRTLPETWKPSEQMVSWASENFPEVTDLRLETEKFVDHFLANGEVKKDWDRAWYNWIRRAKEFAR